MQMYLILTLATYFNPFIKTADAKNTPAYSSGLHFPGIIMLMSDI